LLVGSPTARVSGAWREGLLRETAKAKKGLKTRTIQLSAARFVGRFSWERTPILFNITYSLGLGS